MDGEKETHPEEEESLHIRRRGMHVVYIFIVRLYLVDACCFLGTFENIQMVARKLRVNFRLNKP